LSGDFVVVSNQDSKSAHASPHNLGAAFCALRPALDETVPLLAPIISGKKPVFKHLLATELKSTENANSYA